MEHLDLGGGNRGALATALGRVTSGDVLLWVHNVLPRSRIDASQHNRCHRAALPFACDNDYAALAGLMLPKAAIDAIGFEIGRTNVTAEVCAINFGHDGGAAETFLSGTLQYSAVTA